MLRLTLAQATTVDTIGGRATTHVGMSLLALVALGACDSGPSAPADPDRDGIFDAADQCPNAPETVNNWADSDGCPDSALQLYGIVRGDVEAFWVNNFQASGLDPYRAIQGFYYYSSVPSTPCGGLPLNNAAYCPLNESVYYHDTFLDGLLASIGDMAPAFVIAHEVGHHVSRLLSWIPGQNMSTKQNELQADCFGGAWVRSVETRGLLEPGDYDEVVVALIEFSDPTSTWFLASQHGSPLQRRTAFSVGYDQGGGACTQPDFIGLFPVAPPQ